MTISLKGWFHWLEVHLAGIAKLREDTPKNSPEFVKHMNAEFDKVFGTQDTQKRDET